uniref:UBA domain-containing protein n=1 Tax=Echinostoma caproni TaxID=27848 RepID=A0A183ACU6_9TREM
LLLRLTCPIGRFLTDHSPVVTVVQSAIQSVLGSNEITRRGHSSATTTVSGAQNRHALAHDYTIDQEEDNESEDDNGTDPTQRFLQIPMQTELQAAIAQAQGFLTAGGSGGSSRARGSPQTPNSSFEPTNSTRNSSSHTRITSSALSQALASATNSLRQASHETPMVTETATDSGDLWSTQLAQLAEMGVTDQLAARQALEATNGDLALAIQLLFG